MRKAILSTIFIVLTLLLVTGVALAATWELRFPITATDNTSTNRTYYPAMLEFGGQQLIDSGKIDEDGCDTNIQIGNTSIKYMMSTANVVAVIPNLPANSKVTMNLYTGYSPVQTLFPVVTGEGGYATVSDNANAENTDNFTNRIDGYFDTTVTSANICSKGADYRIFVPSSGNITAIMSKGYVTPDGHTDPSSGWNNETNAYDDNTGTDSLSDLENAWTDWIQFDRDGAYMSSGFRWYADTANNDWEQVEADAYYEGAWNDLTDGAITLTRQAWQEATFAAGALHRVTEYRVRFKYDDGVGGSAQLPLSEVDFLDYSQVSVNGVTSDDRVIEVSTDNGTTFWGLKVDADTACSPISDNLVFNVPFYHPDLAMATIYTKDSTVHELTVTGATWSSDGRVFDGTNDKITLASALNAINVSSDFSVSVWFKSADDDGNVLSNSHASNNRFAIAYEGSKIRAGIYNGSSYYSSSLDTASQDTWYHAVYTWDIDTLTEVLYVDKSIATGSTNPSVTSTAGFVIGERTDGGHDYAGTIGEVQVYDKTLSSTEVSRLYETGVWKYNSSSEYFHYDLLPTGGVPDNASDWIFSRETTSEVTPYTDNISFSVDGSQTIYLAPTSMIDGTLIPDRSNNGNAGVITWGSNTELIITYGEMISYSSPTSTFNGTAGFEMQNALMPATWFALGENVENLPLYDAVYDVVDAMDFPDTTEGVQTIYFIVIVGISLLAYIGLVKFARSVLLGFAAMVIILFVGSSMTVVPMWVPFSILLTGLGIMFLYRQVAY